MKIKSISLLMCALLCLSLVGCGSKVASTKVSPALKNGHGPDFGLARYFSCNSGKTFVSNIVILHSYCTRSLLPSLAHVTPADRIRDLFQFIGRQFHGCKLISACWMDIFKSLHGHIQPDRDPRRHAKRAYTAGLESCQFLYLLSRDHMRLGMELCLEL